MNGIQLRQHYVDAIGLAIAKETAELPLIVSPFGLNSLQQWSVLLPFLQEDKLILLSAPSLDGLVKLFWTILQSLHQQFHLALLECSPGVVLDEDTALGRFGEGCGE